MRASLTLELGFAAPGLVELDPTRTFRLGRNRTNDVVLHDQHASRWHAEISFEGGNWILRDLGTTNGTKINGGRISSAVYLKHGEVIGIGEVRLRFALLDPLEAGDSSPTPGRGTAYPGASDATTLQADELTALFHFMSEAVHESTPRGLVTQALHAVHRQLLSSFCGFLSLDRQEALPRIVVPSDAPVDIRLSQELSQVAQRTRQTVWMASPLAGNLTSKSLSGLSDALCVPLVAGGDSGRNSGPDEVRELFGLLHVYSGTRPFSERQVRFCEVLTGCLANNLRVLRVRRTLEADNQRFRGGVRMAARSEEMVGNSEPMQKLRADIRRFADKNITLLIHGETGSGKELVALGLHKMGRRGKGPFIEVNCGAIPRELAESQFFGHRKGSFTGAVTDHSGHFQRADEGTLFLDEVGDMPLDLQMKLLKVLDSGSFTPLGAEESVKVDVRVLAATHRNLQQDVRDGRFREDLFYRLGGEGLTIEVPSLRDHSEDVPDLARHFLDKFCAEYRRKVSISDAAIERLTAFSWPGNVRQLRAVLERALAMCDGSRIEPADLILPSDPRQQSDKLEPGKLPTLDLAELEQLAILAAVEQTQGNNTHAAALLGMHRDTLLTKLKKMRNRPEKE
jgi:Nif-specific regulatory protein